MFPTGNLVDDLEVPGLGTFKATMISAGIPTVFINAADIGYTGTELREAINSDPAALARLEAIVHPLVRRATARFLAACRRRRAGPGGMLASGGEDGSEHQPVHDVRAAGTHRGGGPVRGLLAGRGGRAPRGR